MSLAAVSAVTVPVAPLLILAVATGVGAAVVAYVISRHRRAVDRAWTETSRVWERGLARFTSVGDLLPDVLFELDAYQNVTYLNPAFHRLTGSGPHAVPAGPGLADLVVPSQRAQLAQDLAAAARRSPVGPVEYHLRGRGAETIAVDLHVSAVMEAGCLAGWRGVLREANRRVRPSLPHPAVEAVVHQILKDIAGTAAARHGESLDRALATVGAYLGVDRCYLHECEDGSGRLRARHLWYAEGVTPQADDQAVPALEEYPWARERFLAGNGIRIADVALMPASARAERDQWLRQGISAILAVPLRADERMLGFLGCEILGQRRDWDDRDVELLETVAEICVQRLQSAAVAEPPPALPEGAVVFDAAGRILAWDRRLETLTGRSEHDMIGASLPECAAAFGDPVPREDRRASALVREQQRRIAALERELRMAHEGLASIEASPRPAGLADRAAN